MTNGKLLCMNTSVQDVNYSFLAKQLTSCFVEKLGSCTWQLLNYQVWYRGHDYG